MLKSSIRKRRFFLKRVKNNTPLYKAVWSHNVMLGPSNVSGLGVFAIKKIKQGDVVCIYSGTMTKTKPSGRAKYVVEGKLWNKQSKIHERRYIDAQSLSTAIGRFLNDACDLYSSDFPKEFKTPFYTNCGFRYVYGFVVYRGLWSVGVFGGGLWRSLLTSLLLF